ncbi:hypothetical protein, partial [Sinomonas notoginsengisoli]
WHTIEFSNNTPHAEPSPANQPNRTPRQQESNLPYRIRFLQIPITQEVNVEFDAISAFQAQRTAAF